MKKNGFFALSLAIATLSVIPAQASSPAVKAGASCSKSGQTITSKGVSYSCLRIAGKLKWQINKKVTKPLPSATSSPSAAPIVSPSPAATPSTSGDPIVTPTPATSVAAFTEKQYPQIGALAKKALFESQKSEKDFLEVYWDPTTTSAKVESYKRELALIKKFYSPYVPDGGKITFLIIGSNKDWAREKIKDLSKDDPTYWEEYNNKFVVASQCLNPNGYVEPDNKWPADYTTYRGLGGGIVPGKGFAFVTMSNCDNYIEADILFHETFHAVQFLNSYKTSAFNGRSSWGWGLLPPWIREGQAEYIGLRLASNFSTSRVSLDRNSTIIANINPRWKVDYQHLTTYELSNAYWAGAIMAEYMFAKFGAEKTLSIYDETVKLDVPGEFDQATRFNSFDKTFLKIFGQTRESFYEEVKPYIEWSITSK